MSQETEANAEGVDFALVAFREEGVWQLQELDPERAADLDGFAAELRRYPGDGGSLGLVSIDEDFFLMVRVLGAEVRILLSDVTAATDWPIARSVVEHLELPLPDDEEDQEPAGDLGIVADLGMHADGHGCAARRLRPLPRRDARRHRRQARLRSAVRRGRRRQRVVSPSSPWVPAMRAALDEARAALTTDDVPIGAVLLDPSGDVVGRGRNRREADADPTAHAEVVALREAAAARGEWRLSGCTLVVTLEPCTMCAGAIVLSRVDRLVFAAFDEKAGAVGSLWDVVRDRRLNHRPEVVSGVLADESSALLLDFFGTHRTGS